MRKPTILILALCALLVGAAQATIYRLGGDYSNRINVSMDSLASGDTLWVTESYVDSSTTAAGVESNQADNWKVMATGTPTITFVQQAAAEFVFDIRSGITNTGVQWIGPMTIVTSGGFYLWSPANTSDITFTDITFESGASSTAPFFKNASSRATSATFIRCHFNWNSSQYNDLYANYHTNSVLTRYIDCTWSGGPDFCVYAASEVGGDALVVEGCELEGFDEGGIYGPTGGSAEIYRNSFVPKAAGTIRKGVNWAPTDAGGVCGLKVMFNDFENSSVFTAVGTGDYAHGDSLWIAWNTFHDIGVTYPVYVRADYGVVEHNVLSGFTGNATDALRAIMVGADTGYDVADTTSAYRVIVRYNTIEMGYVATYNGGTNYAIECKSTYPTVYGNRIRWVHPINPDSTTCAAINLRGATDADIHGNWITRADGLQVFRMSEQAAGQLPAGAVFRSNLIDGTGGELLRGVDWHAAGLSQDSLFDDFSHNFVEGELNLLDIDDVEDDASARSWWGANETRAALKALYLQHGGYGPDEGQVATPSGTYPVGIVSDGTASADLSPLAIGFGNAHTETPVLTRNLLGEWSVTGVTAYHPIKSLADQAAFYEWVQTRVIQADSTAARAALNVIPED